MAWLTTGIALVKVASPKMLPNNLLFRVADHQGLLVALGCCFHAQTLDFLAELNDDAVMDDAVDGGCGGQRVFENLVPLGKDQVRGNHQAAALIAFGQKGEEHLHFFPTLLDIADIVQNDDLELVQLAQFPLQGIIAFGRQEATDQLEGGQEEDTTTGLDKRMAHAGGTVGFAGAGQAKKEQVLAAVDKIAGLQLGQEASDPER